MNTPSNAIPESQVVWPAMARAMFSSTRPFFWSLRRELWEYRAIYLAPLGAAAVFTIGFLINIINVRRKIRTVAWWQMPHASTPYEISAALIMGTALLVGLYYALDTLYGERRDRSILFWKSLPVSDLTAVLSKFTVAIVIVPLFSLAVTMVTQLVMLLLSSIVFLGSGVSVGELWAKSSFLRISLTYFYHIITVHGLWYAPIYAWLLLVSVWAPRAPLIWAVVPPFVICGLEKIAFNTTYCFAIVRDRFLGSPEHAMVGKNAPKGLAQLIPHHFFSEPGLWIGLGIAAVFLAAAVRLRRYRGPI